MSSESSYEEKVAALRESGLGTVTEEPFHPADRAPYLYATMVTRSTLATAPAAVAGVVAVALPLGAYITILAVAGDEVLISTHLSRPLTDEEIAAHRAAVTAMEEARQAVARAGL